MAAHWYHVEAAARDWQRTLLGEAATKVLT